PDLSRLAALPMPGTHHHGGVFCVIDQPELFIAIENFVCNIGGDVTFDEPLVKFESASRGARESTQQNFTCPFRFFSSRGLRMLLRLGRFFPVWHLALFRSEVLHGGTNSPQCELLVSPL